MLYTYIWTGVPFTRTAPRTSRHLFILLMGWITNDAAGVEVGGFSVVVLVVEEVVVVEVVVVVGGTSVVVEEEVVVGGTTVVVGTVVVIGEIVSVLVVTGSEVIDEDSAGTTGVISLVMNTIQEHH